MRRIFLIAILFLPILAFAQQEQVVQTLTSPQTQRGSVPFQLPETLDQAKSFGEKALMALPNAIGSIWRDEVVPVWSTMFSWVKDLWDRFVAWRIDYLIQTVRGLLGGEPASSPAVQQEVKQQGKTIQELQAENEKISQSLKERFLDLFKK